MPADAGGFVATFREEGGAERPLDMTVTDRFLAGPGREVTAEPPTTTPPPWTWHGALRPGRGSRVHQHGHLGDVDGDLDLDFRTPDTGIRCGDTEASLTGMAHDGRRVVGVDTIVTFPC